MNQKKNLIAIWSNVLGEKDEIRKSKEILYKVEKDKLYVLQKKLKIQQNLCTEICIALPRNLRKDIRRFEKKLLDVQTTSDVYNLQKNVKFILHGIRKYHLKAKQNLKRIILEKEKKTFRRAWTNYKKEEN